MNNTPNTTTADRSLTITSDTARLITSEITSRSITITVLDRATLDCATILLDVADVAALRKFLNGVQS